MVVTEPGADERPTPTATLHIFTLPGIIDYPSNWTSMRQFETIETVEMNETMNRPLPPN